MPPTTHARILPPAALALPALALPALALLILTASGCRVLAQAAPPPPGPIATALAALEDGYLVDYDVVADLRMVGRTNRNHGQLMQLSAVSERMSVNNQTGYVAVRHGDTIWTRFDAKTPAVRIVAGPLLGIDFYFQNHFRPEQTPAGLLALDGAWEVDGREGTIVTYRTPSRNTRVHPTGATAFTHLSVDTATARITAIRVVERKGERLATDVVWTYSNWRPAAATADEFAIAGPFRDGGMGAVSPTAPQGSTVEDLVGEPAPAIAGTTLSGEDIRLSPKRTVLFFSATWCGPCKVALEQFNAAGFKLRDGYRLVYVNKDDNAADLGAYFGKHFGRLPDELILGADAAFEDYSECARYPDDGRG